LLEDFVPISLTQFLVPLLLAPLVSGDLIDGTITPKLMQRISPGFIEARRQQVDYLPSVCDFARAIVNAAADPQLESGATIFVGSTEWELA
jgi:hypothetical protein